MSPRVQVNGKDGIITLPKWVWGGITAIATILSIGAVTWVSWASVMLISHNSLAASMVTRMEAQTESIKRIDSKIQQLDDRMFTTHKEN